MKITSSRKDEILKRKADYERRREEYNKKEHEWWQARTAREQEALKPALDAINAKMSEFNLLRITVKGDRSWGGFRIHIECDEYERDETYTSLRWSYSAEYDETRGIINRETGSWSGLQAVTAEQIQSLRQCVEALDFLQKFDWDKYLRIDSKDLYEGIERPESIQHESFDDELKYAQLEELIGTNKAIKVYPFESSYYYGDSYILVDKLTPKQCYIVEVPRSLVEASPESLTDDRKATLKNYFNAQPRRVSQNNITFKEPLVIVDLDNLVK